jgi:hypothetical protein
MKKILVLGLAVAGAVWALGRSKDEPKPDPWAQASDPV